MFTHKKPWITLIASTFLGGCTINAPDAFRFLQQNESFMTSQNVNTKIDILWVVDNSASMDVSQQKLRQGFQAFADKYMQPTWDIQVAVITTDTFMANSAFQTYLNTTIPGSVGWSSTYINSRLGSFQNPSWAPSLVNLSTGKFDSGIKYGYLNPSWGPDYAKLLPGKHDGPSTAFCFEILPYFINGVSDCKVRDQAGANTGTANCLTPSGTENSTSQCVNTVQNDTVRSGKAIIKTMPPVGTPGDSTWKNQLVDDFMINVSTGSSGQGSERGLSSVLQFIADNEGTATQFFRAGSVRTIIFVSDEDDQSMTIPGTPPSGFNPLSGYACDQSSLVSMNGSAAITGNNGYCCSDAGKNCRFGSEGTSCPSKTVDGFTYTPSICPVASNLIPVSTVKNSLDTFFLNLDAAVPLAEGEVQQPNYFIASIVATTGTSIQTLQAQRDIEDSSVGTLQTASVDRGDRYLALGDLVGNGSLSLDIGSSDYTPILNSIGNTIIEKKGTFYLGRAPTGEEEMTLSVLHANGSISLISSSLYTLAGNKVTITDIDFILSLASTDAILVNYQPSTAF